MSDLEQETEFAARRTGLTSALHDGRTPAFLTFAAPNVHYLTGFTGSNGALLMVEERAILFTDPRYETQAQQQSDCEVKIGKGPLVNEIAKWVKRLKLAALGFELNRVSYEEHRLLREACPGVRLKPLESVVETLRMIKSETEIATIRASVKLNSVALEQALEHFQPAMTEIDLAAEIDYRMRLLGADGTAFETIVASGQRTALPHAHPSTHTIQGNQLLLIDMGAKVAGYASDMTRTYALGRLDPKIRRMYKGVLESQLAGIHAVKHGVTCAQVDRSVRQALRGFALDKLFVHSTGHGLGLEIHESPRVGRKERIRLQAGMVITVEPGVYEPGLGGIRIEDTVVVTAQGCDILTPTGKELAVL